jgi:hypothetical protein
MLMPSFGLPSKKVIRASPESMASIDNIDQASSLFIDVPVQRLLRVPLAYQAIILLIGSVVLYALGEAFYNLFLHPLANVPGPFYCRVSKIPWV